MSRLLADPPRCTRRRVGHIWYGSPRASCPGAVGYCAGCPRVPRPGALLMCRICLEDTRIVDVEHANRVTGGFGCGTEGCTS